MERTKNDIKIIFWGTPEFVVPSFEALIRHGYNVVAVVTNPDEPVGRKQILTSPPAKVWAEKRDIPVLQPRTLAKYKLPTTNYKPDLFIVAAYGKIIPKEILEIPALGALNVHPSLLPHWRGPSPIQYTILHGDTEAGVTIIKMDEKMDHGPIIANSKFKIKSSKIKYCELHNELAKLGAELLIETLPKWICGEIKPAPQDETRVTYSKILKKEDGKINWTKPAQTIERQIRAFEGWPGSYTFWQKDEHRLRLEIEKGEAVELEMPVGKPGFVWQDNTGSLLVQTGSGSIAAGAIKAEGKKTLSAVVFLNGHRDIIGQILI